MTAAASNRVPGRRRSASAAAAGFRVVRHRPGLRLLLGLLVALVVAVGFAFGYWLGGAKASVDATRLDALSRAQRARQADLDRLTRELAVAELAQTVDAEAARSLRDTVGDLRDEIATLREEVTFYKSLMAPASLERGLQIAEFELGAGPGDNEFTYHLLLTQTAERRSWIQGHVRMDVVGVRAAADGSSVEEVLALTDVASVEDYPLRYRFRYFQDLEGVVTLPEGFRPRSVRITTTPSGGAADALQRSFDWLVRPG